jgi:FKBP-type peptidyl-prolyl cis-trans isomerase FkpA
VPVHSRVRHLIAIAASVAALSVAACGNDTPAAPSAANPAFSQTDVRIGTGAEAAAGKALTVNYTGWLYDPAKSDQKGLQFETSVGSTPFTFTLGVGQVIAGWDQGLSGMKVGGLRRLVIPSSLAYGGIRNGPIPPYAPLVFEIELLDVK